VIRLDLRNWIPLQSLGLAMTISSAAVAQTRAVDSPPPGPRLWVNYDFVPGNRVIFLADYLDDQVGNFPKRLTFRSGNMEIVELDGQRYLRIAGSSALGIPLPEALPTKFTIEIDVINRKVLDGPAFRLQGGVTWNNTGKTSTIEWGVDGAGLSQWAGGGGVAAIALNEANKARYRGKPSQLRILGDGQYIKIYLDEKRYANIPNANFERSKGLTLQAEGRGEENPVYLGRIRVAAGDQAIYDQLALTGRVATQGILFDTGSDRIRPESAPTLKEIAAMLTAHAELKLSVEGHTDNVGIAAANFTLSEARAVAVTAALIKDYGIEAARLTAKGLGSSKPVGLNTTTEGRQNNRRVELVKN
jgi:OmpA-OmpF porin, OOP family